jgi:hypothetical protein
MDAGRNLLKDLFPITGMAAQERSIITAKSSLCGFI